MRSPVAVFTADNHLSPRTWERYPNLTGDAWFGFSFVVRQCVQRRLPLLLLGDTFDRARPDSGSLQQFFRGMDLLQEHGLDVWYIQGNHDRADPAWPSLHAWPRSAASRFVLGPLTVFGWDYCTRHELPDRLQQVGGADVVLTHQSWAEVQGVGMCDGSLSDFLRGTTVLTGDCHKTGDFRATAKDGSEVVAWSPGATAMQAINEDPDKYFGVLYDDRTVSWKRIPTRPVLRYEVETPEHWQALQEQMPLNISEVAREMDSAFDRPIVYVRYSDDLPDVYETLRTLTHGRAWLFSVPVSVSRVVTVTPDRVQVSAQNELAAAVAELTETAPETGQRVLQLLGADDVTATYATLQRQFAEGSVDAD